MTPGSSHCGLVIAIAGVVALGGCRRTCDEVELPEAWDAFESVLPDGDDAMVCEAKGNELRVNFVELDVPAAYDESLVRFSSAGWQKSNVTSGIGNDVSPTELFFAPDAPVQLFVGFEKVEHGKLSYEVQGKYTLTEL